MDLSPGLNQLTVVATGANDVESIRTMMIRFEPEAELEFAYLVQVSATEVVADYAQMLSGGEADQAAEEDGVIEPDEGVPNDYYIRNVNALLRTLPMASEVVVVLVATDPAVFDVGVPIEDFLPLYKDDGTPWNPEIEDWPVDERYFGAARVWTPYWLTLLGERVIQIRQQYLP